MKSTFASSVLSLLAICQQAKAAATCSNFTIVGQNNYTKPSSMTFAVSQGVVCNGTSDCSVPVGGFVTDRRTINLTDASPDWAFQLISNATGFPFNTTLVGAVENTTYTMKSGSSGYIGFTPTYRCTQGMLSDCDNKDLDGTPVEACTPFSSTDDLINGTLAAIATSPETALALVCNPANTSLASSGNGTNFCINPTNSSSGNTTASDLTAGAGMSSSVGTVLFSVALLVAVFGI
ncbi:hypothetical protein D6D15_04751 [Aureobasidium pullulans]|uniref:Uncharacterized protein n=1 Tax=Aureobasidium pullulans TaxID=5580 RepID=A0A4S9BBH4_AURPU|nr:hypothetical protein D6D15_04751 [Aureobasidium pullulans]